ncbi:MAG TPA: zf-HC2 domain-containing protein [Ktedonobacteraceae bacterium]|nr:zf-HC2 domain-containing protein [Ktedonobacteraceae bacterium]
MMRCSQADKQLQLYVDKQLSLKQIRRLEAHLSICSTCQQSLLLLEKIDEALQDIYPVAEPPDLTADIMRKVALIPRSSEKRPYIFLRPSFSELLAAIVLATLATLTVILGQPSLRAILPIANGHDLLSLVFINILHMLSNINSGTLMLILWVIGTVLGVWITLAVAGNEMRNIWFKAVIDRLPVW